MGARRVQYEGKVHEFPEGTTDAEVAAALGGDGGGGSSAAGAGTSGSPAAPASLWDKVKHYAGIFAKDLAPGAQNPYPGMGQEEKSEAAQHESDADLERAREGRSPLYRAVAPVAGVFSNVEGME